MCSVTCLSLEHLHIGFPDRGCVDNELRRRSRLALLQEKLWVVRLLSLCAHNQERKRTAWKVILPRRSFCVFPCYVSILCTCYADCSAQLSNSRCNLNIFNAHPRDHHLNRRCCSPAMGRIGEHWDQVGWNSSIGLPDGSLTKIWLPPFPTTISLRQLHPAFFNFSTVAAKFSTSICMRFQPPGAGV